MIIKIPLVVVLSRVRLRRVNSSTYHKRLLFTARSQHAGSRATSQVNGSDDPCGPVHAAQANAAKQWHAGASGEPERVSVRSFSAAARLRTLTRAGSLQSSLQSRDR